MTDSGTGEGQRGVTAPRILVMAPNWLGDVIMAAPLLTALEASCASSRQPRCRIVLGIRRAWAPLFESDPRIESLLIVERNGAHRGLTGLWRQARAMRRVGAAAVLLGPPSLRAALAARLAGVPVRIGTPTDGRGRLLTDPVAGVTRGSLHYTEEILMLGSALRGKRILPEVPPEATNSIHGPPSPITEFDPAHYLPGCRDWPAAEIGSGPALWALAPGTTFGQAKTWPAERVGEFLKIAVGERRQRLVLLGDGSTREFCGQLRREAGLPWREVLEGPAAVIDMTGKTDLRAVVGLLKASSGFVGNDSGLMHLAGVLGVPTVGIFGSSNPDWTAPAGPRTAAVVANGFACRPCYRSTCNQPRFCLEELSAQRVVETLDGLIGLSATTGER